MFSYPLRARKGTNLKTKKPVQLHTEEKKKVWGRGGEGSISLLINYVYAYVDLG